MKTGWLGTSLMAFSLAALILTATAQNTQFRVDVRMVEVVATVTDDKGRYVPNLTGDDFILKEDGVEQKIAHLAQSQDLPVSLGIVLDVSGSMMRKIAIATEAIDEFIRTIHKDDDIFLMTFSDRSVILQDFTADRKKLSTALSKASVRGGTALYNAVDDGLLHLRKGIHRKRALLLLTDGQDSGAGGDSFTDALHNVRQENVLVYCLGISPDAQPLLQEFPQFPVDRPLPSISITPRNPAPVAPRGAPQRGRRFVAEQFAQRGAPGGFGQRGGMDTVDMRPLRDFADASGGRAWLVGADRRTLGRILDILAEELRNQYTLGYYPASSGAAERWRRIEVVTKNPKLQVRARSEYFGR